MAVNRYRIEAFFDSQSLKYFTRADDDGDAAWVLFFGPTVGVMVHLWENGEYVLFRSLPIIHMSEALESVRLPIFEELMRRNHNLSIGHYGCTDEVMFEASLPIEDGDVTDDQLERMLRVVVLEVEKFGPKLRRLAAGQEISDEDAIDDLINRLIEGDEDSE